MESVAIQPPSPFSTFKENFPYSGDAVYLLVFERYKQRIKVAKPNFAVKNLKKIFEATFDVAPKLGFHDLTLRDLSQETGLSMGGLYSYLECKESIILMIKEVVKTVAEETNQSSLAIKDPEEALAHYIRYLIFATEILQPWFCFLYFETRSLTYDAQEDSKKIELDIVATLENLIERTRDNQQESTELQNYFIASMILAMIQDRYLKPWKHKQSGLSVEAYAEHVIALAMQAIAGCQSK